jgi:hypothetical protein
VQSEPQYPLLWREMKDGKIILFLGAGASQSSRRTR